MFHVGLKCTKMLLDGGQGALPKVLEAYTSEVALSTDSTRSLLGNYA